MKNIIVCEDLPNTMIEVTTRLTKLGYFPLEAYYPRDAIRLAHEQNPVAVLMDITFDNYVTSSIPHDQRIHGMECGIYLHQLLNIPIIFFTVDSRLIDGNPAACSIRAKYGTITKTPLDLRSLESLIPRAIDTHSAWNSKSAFFSLDRDMKFVATNEAARTLVGANVEGSSAAEVFIHQTILALEQMVSSPSGTVPCSLFLTLARSQQQPISATVTPVRLCGRLAALRFEWSPQATS